MTHAERSRANRGEAISAAAGEASRPQGPPGAVLLQIEHHPGLLMYVKHLGVAGNVAVTFKREEAQVFVAAEEARLSQVNEIASKWPGSARASYVAEGL